MVEGKLQTLLLVGSGATCEFQVVNTLGWQRRFQDKMVPYSEIGRFCDLDFLSIWSVLDGFVCDSNLLNCCEVICLGGMASTCYLFIYIHASS